MDERMKTVEKMVNDGIDEIASKGALNKDTVCTLGDLIDIKKDLSTIRAMEEAGYSEGWRYDDGMRYVNRHGSYGRSYDHGYSRNDLVEHLEQMMHNATSERERERYRRMIHEAEER